MLSANVFPVFVCTRNHQCFFCLNQSPQNHDVESPISFSYLLSYFSYTSPISHIYCLGSERAALVSVVTAPTAVAEAESHNGLNSRVDRHLCEFINLLICLPAFLPVVCRASTCLFCPAPARLPALSASLFFQKPVNGAWSGDAKQQRGRAAAAEVSLAFCRFICLLPTCLPRVCLFDGHL